MPVLARADAWSYRAGKFLARHALVVGLAAAFVAVLIGFSITTYVQSRAHRAGARRRCRPNAPARRRRSERAEAVSDFLIDSFRLADPSHARGKRSPRGRSSTTAPRASRKELSAQPDLQATLLDTIGSVYLSLDLPDDAQPLIEQGLAVRRKLFGEKHLDVAHSLYSLNRVYEKKGDLKTAEALAHRQPRDQHRADRARTAWRLRQPVPARRHPAREGRACRSAERQLDECLRIRIARLGPDHEEITVPLDNLARLAQDRRDFVAAERLYREALRIDLRTRGKDHPQYIRHLHNLATALHEQGDLDAAEPLYRQTVDLFQQVLGPEHSETLDASGNLGRLLMDRGRFDEAQQIYETALAASRKAHPEPHVDVGTCSATSAGSPSSASSTRKQSSAIARRCRSIARRCRPATATRPRRSRCSAVRCWS